MYYKNLLISNKQISFVVQGPVFIKNNITKNCCISIKKYFPGSTIILSTWKNTDTHDLDIDKKIESHDPGASSFYYNDQKKFNENNIIISSSLGGHDLKKTNNTNRMITSSFNGLVSANTEFSVKLRSDMFFQSNNLLKLLQIINQSKGIYTKKKILTLSNLAINPDRSLKILFSPSDFFFAGLTEDLVDLFNVPLMNNEDLNYFNFSKNNNKNFIPIIPKFTPEQYLLYSFIKKKIKINFKNAFDYNNNNKLIHDEIFSNLFIMKRNTRIGIQCYKWRISFFSSSIYFAYTEFEFKKLTGEHGFIDIERLMSNFIKYLKKILLFFISQKNYIKIKSYLIK
jgi:hypothetical protein